MTECMDDKALPEGWPESCQSLDQSLQRKNSVETKPIKLRLEEKTYFE